MHSTMHHKYLDESGGNDEPQKFELTIADLSLFRLMTQAFEAEYMQDGEITNDHFDLIEKREGTDGLTDTLLSIIKQHEIAFYDDDTTDVLYDKCKKALSVYLNSKGQG